jgi:metal-responsive CopG/Arc/MetJ family transcriptional regulator
MKNISIKLNDDVFNETEKIIAKINRNRNRYIREAIAFYNLFWKRRIISHQLQSESKIVQKESMRVLNEFENLQHAD